MLRNDFRTAPVRRLVVMGESNAYGMCAADPLNEWVQVLAFLIRRFQEGPLRVFNNAIPSNVISTRAPGYRAADSNKTAPSALERFERDMLAFAPDLSVYAYGLNDARCGHAIESFMEDYEEIVARTRERLPGTLLVLAGPYWNLQFDDQSWARPEYREFQKGPFGRGGDELVLRYNAAIEQLAVRYGALFVNLYAILEGSAWLLHDDTCHFHDLGHWLIGQSVFAALAQNCSFLAHKSHAAYRSLGLDIWKSGVGITGGTNALPAVIQTWRKAEVWPALKPMEPQS